MTRRLLEDDYASENFTKHVEAVSGCGRLIFQTKRSLGVILSGDIDPL